MYFTPQQLSGGPKYTHGTRVGNWSEDYEMAGHNQKEYLDKKDKGKLLINLTQQKFAKAFQRVPHTFNEDGLLRYKDNVMLMNKQTNAFLVFDMDDKITSVDEAYACTATKDNVGPCGRSILYVESVENPAAGSAKVLYGDQVRFVTNPYIFLKPLYLHSCQLTPQIYARFSRNAEVCLSAKANYNTVWRILPPDGPTSPLIGQPVQANTEMWIEHCATRELLFNDVITYGNQFGRELEVSCKKMVVKHKPQQLENELIGKHVVNLSQKDICQQNIWQILLAVDPSAAEPVAAPEALSYDGAELLAQVKAMLCERGALGVRGVAQVFKIIDKNNNRLIDSSELDTGLRQMGVNLNPEQVEALLKYFDRDGSGSIDLNEFMVAIRVSNQPYTKAFIFPLKIVVNSLILQLLILLEITLTKHSKNCEQLI